MTATTTERDTPQHGGVEFGHPIKAGVKILAGTIVGFDATGFLVPGVTSTTIATAGVAEATIDNTTGANGEHNVRTRRGTHRFANSTSTDQITNADYGKDCYLVDNQTVAKTNGTNTRSVAGKVRGIDQATGQVWVEF